MMNQGWKLFTNKGTRAFVVYSGGREEETHTHLLIQSAADAISRGCEPPQPNMTVLFHGLWLAAL